MLAPRCPSMPSAMFFKNLFIYRFPTSLDFSQLEEQLQSMPLKSVGAQELMSTGFVSPFGEDGKVFSHRAGQAILIAAGKEERLLPGAVVNAEVNKRAKKIEADSGKAVKGKAKKALKEEIIFEMLPKAFIRPSRTFGYIDLQRGLLILDTASEKGAEGIVSMIRQVVGSFPAIPSAGSISVRGLMTGWLSGEELPEKWLLGEACELKDPIEGGATVRATSQELLAEEIKNHLEAGKQVTKLALTHDGRINFTLSESPAIGKVKLLEGALESMSGTETEDLQQEMDARLVLMHGEFGDLIDHLALTIQWEPLEGN